MAANQAAYNDYERAQKRYENYETARKKLSDKVQTFEDATKSIEELTKTIDDQRKIEQEWPENNRNKLKELEDFWNFLQTGKTKTWSLSTKRAQTKFDKNKDQLFAEYVAKHGVRAD